MQDIAFSEMAKRALAKSRSEAFFFQHDEILPEDILAALVGLPSCHAAILLLRLGHDLHLIMRETVAATYFGPTRQSDLSPRLSSTSLRVIERAEMESQALAAANIGTEHLLLGLLQEESPAARVLIDGLDVSLDEVRHLAAEWVDVDVAEDPQQCG